MSALDKANYVKRESAAWKRGLKQIPTKTGVLFLVDVLEDPNFDGELIPSGRVGQLLGALKGWGPATTEAFLRPLWLSSGIGADKPLRTTRGHRGVQGLTERQRGVLVDALFDTIGGQP